MTVPLPEALADFVAVQAAAGGYGSASDYSLALLRDAQQANAREALEVKLLAGIQSLDRGEGREMTVADWERMRARVRGEQGVAEMP